MVLLRTWHIGLSGQILPSFIISWHLLFIFVASWLIYALHGQIIQYIGQECSIIHVVSRQIRGLIDCITMVLPPMMLLILRCSPSFILRQCVCCLVWRWLNRSLWCLLVHTSSLSLLGRFLLANEIVFAWRSDGRRLNYLQWTESQGSSWVSLIFRCTELL